MEVHLGHKTYVVNIYKLMLCETYYQLLPLLCWKLLQLQMYMCKWNIFLIIRDKNYLKLLPACPCCQQGHAGSKTLHQWNHPQVLSWRCWLTQVHLYNGCKMVSVSGHLLYLVSYLLWSFWYPQRKTKQLLIIKQLRIEIMIFTTRVHVNETLCKMWQDVAVDNNSCVSTFLLC